MNKKVFFLFPLMLVFYEGIIYLSNDMYLPAMPQIAKDFEISLQMTQLTMFFWFAGSASLQLILGPLAERYGRRLILFICGFFFIVATFLCATTHQTGIFLVARFFQGMAVCSMMTAGYATVHELFDQKRAIQTLAWMGSVTILAPALGPLIGGALMIPWTWRSIFWILGVAGFLILGSLFFIMPETIKERRPIHLHNLIHSYKNTIKNRQFLIYSLIYCMIFFGIIVWIAAGAFLVIETFKKSVFIFGLTQLYVFVGFIAGTRFIPYLIKYFKPYQIIKLGLTVASVGGIILLFFSVFLPNFFWPLIVGFTFYACGTGMSMSSLNRLSIETSNEPMGVRVALFSSLMSGGGLLSSLYVTLFFNGSSLTATIPLFILSLLSLFLFYKIRLQTQ